MVEMKLLIIASLFCFTSADIQGFLGGWSLAMTFPDPLIMPMCDRVYIALDPSTCTCNGTTVPMTTLRGYESQFEIPATPLKFPTIVVESPNEVPSALSKICECNGKELQQIVFRRVHDNCFVQYEVHTGRKYTKNEPNHANLLIKKAPKTVQELEALCKVDDLEERKGHLICPSMFSA